MNGGNLLKRCLAVAALVVATSFTFADPSEHAAGVDVATPPVQTTRGDLRDPRLRESHTVSVSALSMIGVDGKSHSFHLVSCTVTTSSGVEVTESQREKTCKASEGSIRYFLKRSRWEPATLNGEAVERSLMTNLTFNGALRRFAP